MNLFLVTWLLHFASISSSSFEDSSKVIGGCMSVWSMMIAWHIVVLRFERVVTKLLLIQFTFFFCVLCSSKVWLCLASYITLIFSIASTRILLFLFVELMIREKRLFRFFLIIVLPCVSVVGESRRLTIGGWWLLLGNNFVFFWDKSITLGFLSTPGTFGIGWSWESFAFLCDLKSFISSCVSCVTLNLCNCWSTNFVTINIDVFRVQRSSHTAFPLK